MNQFENYTQSDFSEKNFEWALATLREIAQKVDQEIAREVRKARFVRIMDNIENAMRGVVPAIAGMGYAVLVLLGS
jgi:hypothetical protein